MIEFQNLIFQKIWLSKFFICFFNFHSEQEPRVVECVIKIISNIYRLIDDIGLLLQNNFLANYYLMFQPKLQKSFPELIRKLSSESCPIFLDFFIQNTFPQYLRKLFKDCSIYQQIFLIQALSSLCIESDDISKQCFDSGFLSLLVSQYHVFQIQLKLTCYILFSVMLYKTLDIPELMSFFEEKPVFLHIVFLLCQYHPEESYQIAYILCAFIDRLNRAGGNIRDRPIFQPFFQITCGCVFSEILDSEDFENHPLQELLIAILSVLDEIYESDDTCDFVIHPQYIHQMWDK